MRRCWMNARVPAVVLGCSLTLGCIEIVEPAPPDIDLSDTSGTCPGNCSCTPQDVIGRAYRFTTLNVKEPAELSGTLDNQWASEIANYLLNVIFVVNTAEQAPGTTAAFSTINLTAGPGWRLPGTPYQVDDSFEVQSYCLIDNNLNFNVNVAPQEGAQCSFSSQTTSDLFFHLGPTNDALMCAPLLTPMNATPIMDLSFSFGFNSDCSAISNGYLTGCIPAASAEKICVCSVAGTCKKDGANPATTFPEDWESAAVPTDPLVDYCLSACGTNPDPAGIAWGTFQGTLSVLGVESGGCTVDGQPGYPLSASFTAEAIPPEKFNPQVSGNCLGK